MPVSRRSALATVAGLLASPHFPTPSLAQGAARSTLRFIPHSNLAAVDPVATSGYIVRNYGFMVYDTLFAVDPDFRVQPQMVDSHEVTNDGRTWRFRLREGLKFHDDQPVRGVDCVASIRRWGARDTMGQTLMLAVDEIRATSDRDKIGLNPESTLSIQISQKFSRIRNRKMESEGFCYWSFCYCSNDWA